MRLLKLGFFILTTNIALQACVLAPDEPDDSADRIRAQEEVVAFEQPSSLPELCFEQDTEADCFAAGCDLFISAEVVEEADVCEVIVPSSSSPQRCFHLLDQTVTNAAQSYYRDTANQGRIYLKLASGYQLNGWTSCDCGGCVAP